MSYIATWSGGKDSAYACFKSIQEGLNVSHLLNVISNVNNTIESHGIGKELIQVQAKLLDIPLIQRKASRDRYTEDFKNILENLDPNTIEGVIFGNIIVPEYEKQKHKLWAEEVCNASSLLAIEPLWGISSEEIMSEMLRAGFKAIIINCKNELIDKEWLGRTIDNDFLRYLERRQIDACGEKGEYHSFVTDCPMFKKPIKILKSNKELRGNFWFLNILEWMV
ncbi:MAG: diphthine--ammonia ligase [Promethearchaeota archaeon]